MICTTYFLTFFSELIPPTGSLMYDSTTVSSHGNNSFLSWEQPFPFMGISVSLNGNGNSSV